MQDSTSIALVIFFAAVFWGSVGLLTWYQRVHLGQPAGRLSWMIPGILAGAVLLYTLFRPGSLTLGLTAAFACIAGIEFLLYSKRNERRTAEGRG